MGLATIKKEYQTAFVAFGKSGLPLGRRQDIDELAIIALKSRNKNLIKLFDHLPSLEELTESKTSQKLQAISPPVEPVKPEDDIQEPPEPEEPAEVSGEKDPDLKKKKQRKS